MEQVSREDYEELVEDVTAQLGGDVDVLDNYSGRGMHGAKCLAVVGDTHTLDVFLDACRYFGIDTRLGTMKQDSLGTDRVFYWPNIEIEEEW